MCEWVQALARALVADRGPSCLQVAASLTFIKNSTVAYPACTLQFNGKQCNKKVTDNGGGDGSLRWCAPVHVVVMGASSPRRAALANHAGAEMAPCYSAHIRLAGVGIWQHTPQWSVGSCLAASLANHNIPSSQSYYSTMLASILIRSVPGVQVLRPVRADLQRAAALHVEPAARGPQRQGVGDCLPGALPDATFLCWHEEAWGLCVYLPLSAARTYP